MFTFLGALERTGARVPCGFIHVPYVPAQVAAALGALRRDRALELHQRADLASMSLETMVEAVRLALDVVLAGAPAAPD